ncbi:toll/interleukin-1 receptor domain-containing protein [Cupriavidus basilensis]
MSYAKEDSATVKDFHDYLKTLGLDPWLDSERILPGQRWEREIDRALNEANVVILFMSPRSVDKRSFVTREANNAVQNLRYKKQDDIYIVPVLLEECEVPDDIARNEPNTSTLGNPPGHARKSSRH